MPLLSHCFPVWTKLWESGFSALLDGQDTILNRDELPHHASLRLPDTARPVLGRSACSFQRTPACPEDLRDGEINAHAGRAQLVSSGHCCPVSEGGDCRDCHCPIVLDTLQHSHPIVAPVPFSKRTVCSGYSHSFRVRGIRVERSASVRKQRTAVLWSAYGSSRVEAFGKCSYTNRNINKLSNQQYQPAIPCTSRPIYNATHPIIPIIPLY